MPSGILYPSVRSKELQEIGYLIPEQACLVLSGSTIVCNAPFDATYVWDISLKIQPLGPQQRDSG
ncbi:hypothetical protein MWU76_16845 [Gelidibacter sp. F2691]|nr:hypothetical protein [Gelidibacter sp. F2691]